MIGQMPGSTIIGADEERMKKWIDERSYQKKDRDECVREGIYTAWSIVFTGVYYQDEWYIRKSLTWYGEHMTMENAKRHVFHRHDDGETWMGGSFATYDSFARQMGHGPDVEQMEFPDIPWLVSDIKIEQKRKLKRAFLDYMRISLAEPFFQKLRILQPAEYEELYPLLGHWSSFVLPRRRDRFLIVAAAKHEKLGYHLLLGPL